MNLSIAASSPRVPFSNNINVTNGASSIIQKSQSPTKRAERQTNFKVVIRVIIKSILLYLNKLIN